MSSLSKRTVKRMVLLLSLVLKATTAWMTRQDRVEAME
jgi:hypothetical protein